MRAERLCTVCGHPEYEHGQEREFIRGADSRRELCRMCPGYAEPGYPNGKAWHRCKAAEGLEG